MNAQAITGVSPSETEETTIMTNFPSVGGTALGQTLGQLYQLKLGFGPIVNLGNLIALASIPLALALYFAKLLRRYRLTNRRVIIERGPRGIAERWVDLDNFDAIELVVHPGQDWYPCGELIFRQGNVETLRLPGVSHPEAFMRTCLKTQRAFVAVKRAVSRES